MLRCGVVHGAAKAIFSPGTAAPPPPSRGRHHLLRQRTRSAEKPPGEEERVGEGSGSALPGKSVLLRAGAALFALGFVDAGYSGDWSRIGAISKDTEELLKLGAYVVVPLCVALGLSVPDDSGSES
ncbi:uncharacterized protein LOC100826825 [Brachypodium distachyon]|uniref:DUF7887 domain-containing protein n=1 Tax=Brachypodium distachyon TaxID=15368 RepID=I1H889_BRADI|nr:uncharacterized protein LOC100826825 [Brachypodium distachyon]KQK22971.1 hypothetical protein BRADI_1g70380v3 [Brachypodium distachyon]|eukprot:XP_003561912.1 uncharacterized protein LOC100826825 [Brachypodium distachyon]